MSGLKCYDVNEAALDYGEVEGKPWKKIKKIADGHFGDVFMGEMDYKTEYGHPVKLKIAAKKVDLSIVTYGNNATSIVRPKEEEVKILERLSNEQVNIVGYIGCTYKPEAGYMYLLTEFINGPTLKEYVGIFPNGLEEDQIRMITRQCLQGLKFIHEKNIVHKDIKPDNIMIGMYGDEKIIKIIDFGLACVVGKLPKRAEVSKLWSAPEISTNSNPKCDSFSMGLTVYFMATKEHPFEHEYSQGCVSNVIKKIRSLEEELPDLSAENYSAALRRFYKSSTRKDVDRRVTCCKLLEHDFITEGNESGFQTDKLQQAFYYHEDALSTSASSSSSNLSSGSRRSTTLNVLNQYSVSNLVEFVDLLLNIDGYKNKQNVDNEFSKSSYMHYM